MHSNTRRRVGQSIITTDLIDFIIYTFLTLVIEYMFGFTLSLSAKDVAIVASTQVAVHLCIK